MRAARVVSAGARAIVAPRIAAIRPVSVVAPVALRCFSTEGPVDLSDEAILKHFLELDAATPQADSVDLPIKLSGKSGDIAASLYAKSGKKFGKIVEQLDGLNKIVKDSGIIVQRFFVHPNYSPEECAVVVDLLTSNNTPLKDFDKIADEHTREVILADERNFPEWEKARKAISALKLSPEVKDVLNDLSSQARLDLLGATAEKVIALQKASENVTDVTVSSAVPLTAAQTKEISSAVGKYLDEGAKSNISFVVEPAILGGLTVQLGNKSIDLSSATQLMNAVNESA